MTAAGIALVAAGLVCAATAAAIPLTAAMAPDSLVAGGAPVVGVEFSGTDVRSPGALERAVARALTAETGSPAFERPWRGRTFQSALAAVLSSYREVGHLSAAVMAAEAEPTAGGVSLHFHIDEGDPVLLGDVDIVGNELHDDAEIRAMLGLSEGQPFRPAEFEAGLEHLLGRYENEGRPYAAIEPRDLSWDEVVRFTLAVNEGPPVAIDGIRISGNRVTRPKVVERIARLEPGDAFSQTELERAEARLRRSGLFSQVEPIALAQGADRTRNEVLIRVREGRTNTVSGALGYAGAEAGFTGLFDLSLGNIAGTGRRGSAHWEGRGNDVELYRFSYDEPWVFGSPVSARFKLARTIQGPLYTQSQVSVGGALAIAADFSAEAGWERQSTIESTVVGRRAKRDALLVGGSWDVRDSSLNPRRGMRIRSDLTLGRKEFVPAPEAEALHFGSWVLSVDIERAQGLGRSWVSFVRARGVGIKTDEEIVPFYELFPLGGATSLRGYREEQFRGAHVELLQFEQRYLLGTDGSRLVGFVDIGHISTRGTVLASPGEPDQFFKLGYGVGIRLGTRLGLVGLDYALGEGDGPLDGKLHVAVDSAF